MRWNRRLRSHELSFGGRDLYSGIVEKAAAMGFSLIANHPFVDGNKRIGHAATEIFLVLNRSEVTATVDEQEAVILSVAAGKMDREAFARWLDTKVRKKEF